MVEAAQRDPRVNGVEDRAVLLQLLIDQPGNLSIWEPETEDLAESCRMTPDQVERSVDNLVRAGVITRVADAARTGQLSRPGLRLNLGVEE